MDVINSTIINSFARFEGGAFYSYRAPVIITGSHLENCSSGWVSGALGSEGTEPTEFHVTDSTIVGCWTYGLGGFFRARKRSKFTLTRVHVSKCTAWLSGGAVSVEARGSAIIQECTFEDCKSEEASGGAVHVEGSLDMHGTKITRCSAGTNGGGLSAKGGGAKLVNVQFIDCAAGTDAGALEASDSSEVEAWRLTVVNSTTSWYGHAILVTSSQLVLTVVDFLQQPCDGPATIHATGIAIGDIGPLRKVSIEDASCSSGGARLLSYEGVDAAISTNVTSCQTENVCAVDATCKMVAVQTSSTDFTPECSCQLPFIPSPEALDATTAAYDTLVGCLSVPRGDSLRVVAKELQLSVLKTEGGDNTIARNLTLTLLGTDRRKASEASWVARATDNVSWLSLLTSSATEPTAEASPWEVIIEVVASGLGLAETTVEPLKTSIAVDVQA